MKIIIALLAFMGAFHFSLFSQTNNLGTLGITGFKQKVIDPECRLIVTYGDTAIGNNYKFSLDNQSFRLCSKTGEATLETENGVWRFTILNQSKYKMELHDSTYIIENQKEYTALPSSVKIKMNIMAILLNNFLTINQVETSVNVQAKLCGIWHVHTLGLTSIEATLDNNVESAQFGTDNPNCKNVGQVISCYGDQHICIATTVWNCSCRYISIPIIGIGF